MPRDARPRSIWTRPAVLAALAFVILVLGVTRCGRAERSVDSPDTGSVEAPADTAPPAPAPSAGRDAQADVAPSTRRRQAVVAAIDAVHAYLQAVGARDFAKADALWQANREPTAHDEAGLRELGPLRALRMQNLAPALPPGNEVPASLEVPVQLVAYVENGAPVRLNGHYRVRRDPVRARWEIAGAALRPVID